MKSSPRPEGDEIEPFGDGEGLDKVTVADLIEGEMKPHAAQDAEEDRIRVFINQKTIDGKQLIGMEHQDKLVPSPFITPGCETFY